MKLLFRYKGGKGSGHHGHAGRPGKQGGSLPGTGTDTVKIATSVFADIMDNKRYRNLAIALAADGGIDDITNVIGVLEDELGEVDYDVESEGGSPNTLEGMTNELFEFYEAATAEDGYLVEDQNSISKAREAWEKKYYGKVVGGFQKGEAYAIDELRKFVQDRKNSIHDVNRKKRTVRNKLPMDAESQYRRMNTQTLRRVLESREGSLKLARHAAANQKGTRWEQGALQIIQDAEEEIKLINSILDTKK